MDNYSWKSFLTIAVGARNQQPRGTKQSRGRPAKPRRDINRGAGFAPYNPLEVPPPKLGDGPDILWRVLVDQKFRNQSDVLLIEARSIGAASIKAREFMGLGDSIYSIQEAKVQ